jgi:hypothetical protein
MFSRKQNKKQQKKENWRWEAEVRIKLPKEEKGRKVRVDELIRLGRYDEVLQE